ncbi:hypothetical protein P7C70_g4632, partial [Phenoliferia sp. Uapishka_3]
MAQYGSYHSVRQANSHQSNPSASAHPYSYRERSEDSNSIKRDLDEDDLDVDGAGVDEDDADGRPKKVLKRGAKACTACVFIESQRGRHKTRTSDIMAAKLKQMQATLDNVLHTIGGNPPQAPPPVPNPTPQFSTQHTHHNLPNLSLSPDNSHSRSRQKTTVNPLLLDAVTSASEHERYPAPSPHDSEHSHSNSDPYGSINRVPGTSHDSVTTPGPLGARVAKQVKFAAGSFAGDPIKFPMRVVPAEPKSAPALLLEKIVTVEEVSMLFELFFDFCQPQAPFLDRELHTPTYTALYAPFLFTCICTVASRYVPNRPGLYAQCRATAIRLAAENVFSGSTSISIVQGCLILAHWNQPGYPTEGDRCYLFSGMAVRMSLELGLHVKTDVQIPPGEPEQMKVMYEKDARNRERTWIHCVVTDRSLSLQMGKPPCISKEDYIMRNAMTWSILPLANASDIGICVRGARAPYKSYESYPFDFWQAIADLHHIVAQAMDALYSDANSYTGYNANLDHGAVVRVFLAQTEQWRIDTLALIRDHYFYFNYYRVFVLSFAIQQSHDKPQFARDLVFYVVTGFECASAIVKHVTDKLGPTGRFRYGMDSTFVYVTYCACFLLKLIHPSFSNVVDSVKCLNLARDTATILEQAAVDASHTPAIYAAFLRSLIDSKLSGDRTAAATRAGSRAGSPVPERAPQLPGLTASLQDILDANAAEDAAMGLNATSDALNSNGFWDNMLMPGFGGRLGTLSGGGAMLSNNHAFEGWGEPALFSRAGSPQPFSDFIFSTAGDHM